ncbi:MAG: hypothetical protein H0X33_14870 [Taibaiella sp.]|nr:hypothetical protein [Taibaiella sp.]
MASLFQAKVYKAIQAQVRQTTADIHHGGLKYAKDRVVEHDFNAHIGPVLMGLYKTAGVAVANRTSSVLAINKAGEMQLMLKYRTFGHNEKWTQEIISYFRQYLLDKAVTPISDTTKNIILRMLSKGIDEGKSVAEIVKQLETTDINRNRAQLIVRTETTRAANYGGMMSAYNNDYEMEKTWNEVKDKRTRITHRHGTGVGGEKIELLDRFSNGLLFPGDPDGSASEVCNCRCVLTYSPKRDANGRLIPKKKKPVQHTEVPTLDDAEQEQEQEQMYHPTLASVLAQGAAVAVISKIIDNLN